MTIAGSPHEAEIEELAKSYADHVLNPADALADLGDGTGTSYEAWLVALDNKEEFAELVSKYANPTPVLG